MSKKHLKFTGERMIPGEVDVELELEHRNRYSFACQYLSGRRVLDAACGVGYGSAILARSAKAVVGIDISPEAVAYCQEHYKGDRVRFQTASIASLPFPDACFDAVVSYETLEHVDQDTQNRFFAEINRVLTPDGLLIMSTPNKDIYQQKGQNHFHIHELSASEFIGLLSSHFKNLQLFSQKYEVCNIIASADNAAAQADAHFQVEMAEYLIAVCSNAAIAPAASRVEVREDDYLKQMMDWAVGNHELNEKSNAHIKELDLHIEELGGHIRSLDQERMELQSQIEQQQTCLELKEEEFETHRQTTAKLMESYADAITEANQQNELLHQELEAQQLAHETELAEFVVKHEEEFAKYILKQEEIIRNKEGHIAQLLKSDRELAAIKGSRTFRLARGIGRISSFFAPHGSYRRLFLGMAAKFVRHPFRFLRKANPRRIAAFFKIARTEGPTGAARRVSHSLLDTQIPPSQLELTEVEKPKRIADYKRLVFPVRKNPVVSIVIPVYNQFGYTYSCLKSILDNSGEVAYEIIVGDDRSSDLTTQLGEVAENIRIVTHPENIRFLKNCNAAAGYAKGKYTLFLNNDTQVQPGWLRPLVDLMEQDETIGITGSKLVYADGTLQEAGGIFWNDASAWNYGNGSDPDLSEFNYVKDVDYISGAALMIRTQLWEETGGFDEAFAPAYCEDADLCFAVRRQGYRVVYQPASVVVHFEGASNGTDLSSGQKAYQVVNTEKLREKWGEVLRAEHFANGQEVFLARDRSRFKKSLLMIDHYVPHFDKDAGSRTVYQYLEFFMAQGYNVKFIGDNFYKHEPYTSILQQMGVEVLYGPQHHRKWQVWLRENGKYFDYVFLNRPHISEKYIDVVRQYSRAKVIYYGHDLHLMREEREYNLTGDKGKLRSSEKWKGIELELMRKADAVYYPSNVEVDVIHALDASINAKAIPGYIYPVKSFANFNYAARRDMIFVGGFGHPPNLDGILWFAKEVMPLVREAGLSIKLYVVGSNATEKVQSLACDDIIIKGFVSDEELIELYHSCRICVVPLRYGAGVKGKVVEAMYYQIPVITTSIGAEGLPEVNSCLTIADSAEAFAQEITGKYQEIGSLSEQAKHGLQYVNDWFTQKRVDEVLREDFEFSAGLQK